ncbi:orotidine-5'-phosphate decarboxylase [Candidatus Microgenomates bacterium]|nr:orotidine-5'-phosphate decarboxylase [Candidatus Microgenomates bacterium]
MKSFIEKLENQNDISNSLLCVGLDADLSKLPQSFVNRANPLFQFNKAIIATTHDLVGSYKLNSAFYESLGDRGITQLKMTIDYLRATHPTIPLILDAKRADIGNTNDGYIKMIFDYLGVDAVTLHPYLGREAVDNFLSLADRGIIILCRTSNPGAGEFQDLMVEGKPLYMHVAEKVSTTWNGNNNCLLVVGATYPDEMKQIRTAVGDMTFLVPGIGAQGGDVEKTVHAGINSRKKGIIVHSSRGIIYASSGDDFAERAREEAIKLRNEINRYR